MRNRSASAASGAALESAPGRAVSLPYDFRRRGGRARSRRRVIDATAISDPVSASGIHAFSWISDTTRAIPVARTSPA